MTRENEILSGPALARLSYVGKATAFLCWGGALVHIAMQAFMWFVNGTEIQEQILAAYSDLQPILASAEFSLSELATCLLLVLDFVPVIVTSVVLVLIGLFFYKFSQNKLWTINNSRLLWCAGIMKILTPMVYAVIWTLTGLAISLDLPVGEKIFHTSLELNSDGIDEIVMGLILCAFAWMIRETVKINEESKHYI